MNERISAMTKARGFAAAVVVGSVLLTTAVAWMLGVSSAPSRPSTGPALPVPAASTPSSVDPTAAAPVATTPPADSRPTSAAADDHGHDPESPADPTSTPTIPAEVIETGTVVAARWLNASPPITAQQWLFALRPFLTPAKVAELEGVDPADTVPLGLVGSPVQGEMFSERVGEVTVPVVSYDRKPVGTLTLELVLADRWLVSRIDWSRA